MHCCAACRWPPFARSFKKRAARRRDMRQRTRTQRYCGCRDTEMWPPKKNKIKSGFVLLWQRNVHARDAPLDCGASAEGDLVQILAGAHGLRWRRPAHRAAGVARRAHIGAARDAAAAGLRWPGERGQDPPGDGPHPSQAVASCCRRCSLLQGRSCTRNLRQG
eukprot:SAG31_NODE_906_length_11091_cov_22.589065_13_plen_163_part_00